MLIESMPPTSCDVLIIGAGPAGSATALRLADLLAADHRSARIVMVETSHFDSFRIGESLPPDSRALFAQLGVLPAFLDAAHQPCWGSCSSWGDNELGFNDFALNIHGHGWHVERNRFDALLAEQAADRDVEVYEGWRVRDAVAFVDGGYQISLRDDEQREQTLSARIVVDASGQAGVFTHAVGARRIYDDRLVCIAGVFNLKEDSRIDQRTLLEAAPYGWWYCARINAEQAIVSVTSDSSTARLHALSSLGSWFAHLARTRHMGERLHGSKLASEGLQPWAAPCFHLDRSVGVDWLAVGDSAISYDPIAAQGIHKALSTGIAAAEAIAHRLQDRRADFSDYSAGLGDRHRDYLRLRQTLYASEQRWHDQPFWQARRKHGALLVASAA